MNLELIISITAGIVSLVAALISYLIYRINSKSVAYLTKPDIILEYPFFLIGYSKLDDGKYHVALCPKFYFYNTGQGYAKNVNIFLLIDSYSYHDTNHFVITNSDADDVKMDLSLKKYNRKYYVIYKEFISKIESQKKHQLFSQMGLVELDTVSRFFKKDMEIFSITADSYLKELTLVISYDMFDKSTQCDYYKIHCIHNKSNNENYSLIIKCHDVTPSNLLRPNPYRPSRKYRYK